MTKSETPETKPESTALSNVASPKPADALTRTLQSETGLGVDDLNAAMKQIDAATQDNIGMGEIQVSRISIAQPGTPEVAEGREGYKAGMLLDNMSREVLTTTAKPPWLLNKGIDPADIPARPFMPVVCVFRLPTEFAKWPTKEEREAGLRKFHWKDIDLTPRVREGLWKPKGTWKGEGAPPVTEHLNILMFGLDDLGAINTNYLIASYSRTSFRAGQKLVTALNQHRMNKMPWWGRVYYLYTDSTKVDGNTFYFLMHAKGPKLVDYGDPELAGETFVQCFKQAAALSEPEGGKSLQELMINAAAFSDDDEHGDVDVSGEFSGDSASDDPNF